MMPLAAAVTSPSVRGQGRRRVLAEGRPAAVVDASLGGNLLELLAIDT
jgi:hypothetical protein